MRRCAPLLALCPLTAVFCAPQDDLRVHIISGAKEYGATESMTRWQTHIEKRFHLHCTRSVVHDKGREIPNIEALDDADLLVVYCRRVNAPPDALRRLQAWAREGKPVLGIRTASHAFQNFLEMDRLVYGGDYQGHGPDEKEVHLEIAPGAAGHPILAGIEPWTRPGKIYRNPKLAPTTTVLLYTRGARDRQPVAWVNGRPNGRAFYTSLGLPSDFADQRFLRLLDNALRWLCPEVRER